MKKNKLITAMLASLMLFGCKSGGTSSGIFNKESSSNLSITNSVNDGNTTSSVSSSKNENTASNVNSSSSSSVSNNSESSSSSEVVKVTDITLNKTSITLCVDEQETLIATISPENVANKTITWKSENNNVASVDEDGVVTAKGEGTTTITATIDEVSATCEVIVEPKTIKVESITLNKTSVNLEINNNEQLVATILPENATNQEVKWSSSNEEIAIVDKNGLVTAIGVGETTITATIDEVSATCLVNVTDYNFTFVEYGAGYELTSYTGTAKKVVVPSEYNDKAVLAISSSAFSECDSIESITLPFVGKESDGTENTHLGYIFGANSYSENATYVPQSLKEVIIVSGTIDDYAFYGCSSLTSIVILENVSYVGNYVFSGCPFITIYCEIEYVGWGKWSTTWNFLNKPVYYGITEDDIINIQIDDFIYVIINNEFILANYIGDEANVEIPSKVTYNGQEYDVTIIGECAFSNIDILESVIIPESITTIRQYAFYNCSNFSSVIIPLSVTTIGYHAFDGCTSLTIYCEAESKCDDWDDTWNYSHYNAWNGVRWYRETNPNTYNNSYWHYDEAGNIEVWTVS